MQNPKLILADEPIASLDPMNAQIVMETLRRIHEEDGRTVIANLHTLDTARKYCDRVIGMRQGRIVFDGTPEQLTTGIAREIYGAGADFSEAATSTEIREQVSVSAWLSSALPVGAGQYQLEWKDEKTNRSVLATTALTSAAFAGGHGISEFRIGILAGENAQDRLNNNECLRERTEDLLGVETKLFAPADYDGVIQGLLGGTIDMAWLGASGYAKTFLSDENAVQPVLVAVNLDGSYGYHSIGFARKDSNITSLEDMQGKAFGLAIQTQHLVT